MLHLSGTPLRLPADLAASVDKDLKRRGSQLVTDVNGDLHLLDEGADSAGLGGVGIGILAGFGALIAAAAWRRKANEAWKSGIMGLLGKRVTAIRPDGLVFGGILAGFDPGSGFYAFFKRGGSLTLRGAYVIKGDDIHRYEPSHKIRLQMEEVDLLLSQVALSRPFSDARRLEAVVSHATADAVADVVEDSQGGDHRSPLSKGLDSVARWMNEAWNHVADLFPVSNPAPAEAPTPTAEAPKAEAPAAKAEAPTPTAEAPKAEAGVAQLMQAFSEAEAERTMTADEALEAAKGQPALRLVPNAAPATAVSAEAPAKAEAPTPTAEAEAEAPAPKAEAPAKAEAPKAAEAPTAEAELEVIEYTRLPELQAELRNKGVAVPTKANTAKTLVMANVAGYAPVKVARAAQG